MTVYPMKTDTETGVRFSTDRSMLDMDMVVRYLQEASYWAKGRGREVIEEES